MAAAQWTPAFGRRGNLRRGKLALVFLAVRLIIWDSPVVSYVSEESLNALVSMAQVVASPAILLRPKRRCDTGAIALRASLEHSC
jgi:hypothetical protein